MRKTLLLSVMIFAVVTLAGQEQKEVVTGASYVDDVYYSLENGNVDTVARKNWDLGFSTDNFSVSILANTTSGVEVYTWHAGDTADWVTLDTTGMEWTPMHNSIETFDEGALSFNQTGHPDYGWGTYNMGNHVITGDSLFVIKTVAGVYKKLAIIRRAAMDNTWEFKYANLDSTDEQSVPLNSGEYNTKSFVYYSIDNDSIIDREPAKADWDLLFTKYTDHVNYSPASDVSGILTNEDHVVVQEVRESALNQATFTSFEDTSFTAEINTIGFDWKKLVFNPGPSFELIDTVVYFIKSYSETDSSYYKIYFTGFTGMSEGRYNFVQEKLSLVSSRSPEMIQMLEVYPNPASNNLNVVFDHIGETSIQVIDMTGRVVFSTIHNAGGFTNLSLDIAQLNPGLFFLKVNSGDRTGVIRFIKE